MEQQYHRRFDFLDRLTEKVYTAINTFNPYRKRWGNLAQPAWLAQPAAWLAQDRMDEGEEEEEQLQGQEQLQEQDRAAEEYEYEYYR